MTDKKRLMEVAFPLKQASIDSVHEKNVRHGHISTLHIWPARRPLAASRAALIATLLPDPGDKEQRDEILQRLAGSLVKRTKSKKQANGQVEDVATEETEGGILHWGRESGPDLDWFREEIRKAYGGRAPKVLDPFAGGGAIPLEAMRLGCEVTAADINPVAWFILKCTLEYPQQLAGQTRRLPEFALRDREFMAAYLKAQGLTPATIKRYLNELQAIGAGVGAGFSPRPDIHRDLKVAPTGETIDLFGHDPIPSELLEADLAWHVRAWGLWVLKEARKSLARFYPTYAEYCSEKPYAKVPLAQYTNTLPLAGGGQGGGGILNIETSLQTGSLKLVPLNELGEPQIELLNAGFAKDYLENPKNPRWIAKPTVAYLWARTVKCKSCRAVLPLLKTRWLCKKDNKRVLLTMTPDVERWGVIFGIDSAVKQVAGNTATKREHDKKLGAGTMSRSGASCPCCGTIMTMEDIRLEGRAGKLGSTMTTVVMDSPGGKEYRLPTPHELEMAEAAQAELEPVFADVPFGLPSEPLAGADALGFRVPLYGFDQWHKLFTPRQLLSLAVFIQATREIRKYLENHKYSYNWKIAISTYLAAALDRLVERNSANCHFDVSRDSVGGTFQRYAFPIVWDFAEVFPLSVTAGGYPNQLEWVALLVQHVCTAIKNAPPSSIMNCSATNSLNGEFDVVITDPPYYDAIPYSDLMDFFYVWLRRTLYGLSPEFDAAFSEPLSPKWNHETNDGELIDDSSRFGGSKEASKRNYEEGMARAFVACHSALKADGRLVVVFAHKHPDAWETLVSAIIKAGFVVDASWPIQTEMGNRTRAFGSAALSSSIWMVCKKRNPMTKAGWDAQVLQEMETNIVQKLRDFWDAGIHGPDFVWAATGPALESYSRYPAVRKASESGALMGVNEFLRHVRRIVVDFVVGRVLTGDAADNDTIDHALDNVTSYYLLHRYDFGMKDAPAGACILYAVSCGLSERELTDQYELLVRSGSSTADDETNEEDDEASEPTGSGGQFKLNPWIKRKHKNLGQDSAGGRPSPLIDQIHKLMLLWQAGDVIHVNEYLDARGLRRSRIFVQLLQALIELAPAGDNERATLERLSNHVKILGGRPQETLPFDGTGE
jgi:adenine-specific DNA methylase